MLKTCWKKKLSPTDVIRFLEVTDKSLRRLMRKISSIYYQFGPILARFGAVWFTLKQYIKEVHRTEPKSCLFHMRSLLLRNKIH